MKTVGNQPSGDIVELSWDKARQELLGLNDELVRIIDEISPGRQFSLFKIKYTYGSEVVQKGQFQLPDSFGHLRQIGDSNIPESLQNKLSYNFGSNPVGVVLNKSAELYINLDDRIIPFAIIPPGKVFGTWKILDDGISHCPPRFSWDLTAGARTIFMLPKISKEVKHLKLCHDYLLASDKPASLLDHHKIFTEIASYPELKDVWSMDFLFFSGKWFEKIHSNDRRWDKFKQYLLSSSWKATEFWRNKFIWDLMYTRIQNRQGIKPSAYVSDLVKHLFTLSLGVLPGFVPAVDDSLAPVSLIQKAYIESYRLDDYIPVIMHPAHFHANLPQQRLYYSMAMPTAMELAPKSNERFSMLEYLFHTKSLLNKYLNEIHAGELGIGATPMCDIPSRVKFDYYHADVKEQKYREIVNSEEILGVDKVFASPVKGFEKNTVPPIKSSFFKGCVMLSS
ncbi:MAG: hypothetical protein KAS93_03555 [Gammaproteobacteria bacterium]|nr:hypothetical protein [Gammaproteobacteria bacterium]